MAGISRTRTISQYHTKYGNVFIKTFSIWYMTHTTSKPDCCDDYFARPQEYSNTLLNMKAHCREQY